MYLYNVFSDISSKHLYLIEYKWKCLENNGFFNNSGTSVLGRGLDRPSDAVF